MQICFLAEKKTKKKSQFFQLFFFSHGQPFQLRPSKIVEKKSRYFLDIFTTHKKKWSFQWIKISRKIPFSFRNVFNLHFFFQSFQQILLHSPWAFSSMAPKPAINKKPQWQTQTKEVQLVPVNLLEPMGSNQVLPHSNVSPMQGANI